MMKRADWRILIGVLPLMVAVSAFVSLASGGQERPVATNPMPRLWCLPEGGVVWRSTGAARFRFENFTTANGLPDNHVFAVLVDGDRVWAGTRMGWAVYENHAWKTYSTKDGLAHRAVLSLALDSRTGDVWAGTMGGLSRISAGRIVSYTQLTSGLSNDVVYGVSVEAITCGSDGSRRLPPEYQHRSVVAYNERNTPMTEIGHMRSPRHHEGLLRGLGQRRPRI